LQRDDVEELNDKELEEHTEMNKYTFMIKTLLFTLFLASPLVASSELYTVYDVKVDVVDKSASAAQKKAMVKARRKAFDALMFRLSEGYSPDQTANVSDSDIEDMLLDYEVTNQKNSNIRYVATMNLRFDPRALSGYVTKHPTSTSAQAEEDTQADEDTDVKVKVKVEVKRSPVLVIPLMIDNAGKIHLWEDNNKWLQTWAKHKNKSARAPVIVPLGDLRDINMVSPTNALNEDPAALQAIIQRYGASGAVVAVIEERRDPTDQTKKIFVSADKMTLEDMGTQAILPSESVEGLDNALTLVVAAMEGRTTTAQEAKQQRQRIHIQVPVNNLRDWLTAERNLKSIQQITMVQPTRLSRREVNLEADFTGSIEGFQSALGARGYQLISTHNGALWELRQTRMPTSQY
jgi:hypothetical protein